MKTQVSGRPGGWPSLSVPERVGQLSDYATVLMTCAS